MKEINKIMYCPKCGTKALDGAGFCQNCGIKLNADTPAVQSAPILIPDNQIHQSGVVPPNIPEKKNSQKISLGIIGSVVVIAMIAIVLILRGRTKYSNELLFDDLPATRFFEMTRDEVINKKERISLSQTYADEEKEFLFQYSSSGQHLSEEDFVQDGIGSNDIETARQILIEWFQRHPIKHDITLRFTEEAVDTGYDSRYLVYEVYIEQEEYGILRIDPDTGNMVMDSVSDSYGNWVSIQAAMEQWYLVYYWGCTDDSGYYSEPLGGSLYVMYDETGTELLEYDAIDDSFAICNWDICCSVEVE